MQLFSADATMFLNIYFLNFLPPKTWKKLPQKLLIISPQFFSFSIANRLKTSPNLNLCSLKIAHRATYV